MINLRRVLDKRSYRVYLLHDEEHKFFPEIGELIGVTRSRAWQIYRAGIQRIELKKRGGDVLPEYAYRSGRSTASIGRLARPTFIKGEVIRALKRGKLRPGGAHNYGSKTHREVCKWAGVTAHVLPWRS